MQVARADRKALPEDPEELRKFFLRRAQERDGARETDGKPGKTDGDAKTPKDSQDQGARENARQIPQRTEGHKHTQDQTIHSETPHDGGMDSPPGQDREPRLSGTDDH